MPEFSQRGPDMLRILAPEIVQELDALRSVEEKVRVPFCRLAILFNRFYDE
jgi:hypothetical protein